MLIPNTVADLVALLRDPDARTAAALEAALGTGELEVWLQARWRPAADAPRLAGRVRDLRQRLRGRGVLARFALLNLLEPGQPLPLRDGCVLHALGELEELLQQAPPDRRRALLAALQCQVAEGFFAEWLRAGGFPDAARMLAVLEECQSRYPNEPLLLAYAVRWCYASTVGVPFAEAEVADPRELAARITGSAAGRRAGLAALQRGWLRTWLIATGRLNDPAALDRTLDDPRLPADYSLEIVLRLLDPALPWPQPDCDPQELNFGWVRPDAVAERTLTVRATGSGFLWGDARIEPPVAGVTLAPTTVQGPSSAVRLRVEPRGLPLGSRHAGQVVVRTAGGEVRAPWRFAVGVRRSLVTARTLALVATVALVVAVGIAVMTWYQPLTIGREAVWNPPGGKWEEINSKCALGYGKVNMTCIASGMKQAGASPQAIAFTETMYKTNNDVVYMNSFKETGRVDVAEVTGPVLNDPQTSYYVLVNGIPNIIELWDKVKNIDLKKDRDYRSLSKKFPNIELWPIHGFEKMEPLPQGEQRFIFNFILLNGCRGCAVAGWAKIALDFDQSGRFLATKLISLTEE